MISDAKLHMYSYISKYIYFDVSHSVIDAGIFLCKHNFWWKLCVGVVDAGYCQIHPDLQKQTMIRVITSRKSNINMPMTKNTSWQIQTKSFQSLPLGLIRCQIVSTQYWKLQSLELYREISIFWYHWDSWNKDLSIWSSTQALCLYEVFW
jgi:hypothetical protein